MIPFLRTALAAVSLTLLIAADFCQAAEADARRVVTLSPHLAELVYAVGAGDTLVGVSAYSDYPEAVRALPQVGDAFMVDQEQLALLRPDLILAWYSGTPAATVEKLRKQGFDVERIRTRSLADVAEAIETIGRLTGRSSSASKVRNRFESQLAGLRAPDDGQAPVRVFYQISQRPLYTVNGSHYASELIERCGGRNIFADLGELAPMVSEESVLARDPEAIVAGGSEDIASELFSDWQRWHRLSATRLNNYFVVNADLLGRPSDRLALAGAEICDRLAEARARRGRAASE